MFVARNQLWTPGLVRPRFDALGGGFTPGSTSVTSCSWAHTITGNCLVVVMDNFDSTSAFGTDAVTVGSTTVPLLGTPESYDSGPEILYVFGLLTPPTGPQTIHFNATGSSGTLLPSGNSLSYFGVTGFGTLARTSGTGTAMSQTVTAAVGQLIVQAFGNGQAASLSTPYNQTQRWSAFPASSVATIIGDAPGAASVSFTATGNVTGPWGGIALPLL
jgi:hypothetical protein